MSRILKPFPRPIYLTLLAAVFLCAAWYVHSVFAFLGFMPLLALHHHYFLSNQKYRFRKYMLHVYLALLLWNVGTTWWIYNSTVVGALLAFVLNSFFMTVPFALFYLAIWAARTGIGIPARWLARYGYYLLVPLYLAFEFLHLRWDLSWSWLNLGNVFSTATYLVQWYDVTGTLGGSFWILMVNVALFSLWAQFQTGYSTWSFFLPYLQRAIIYCVLLVMLPVVWSVFRYNSVQIKYQKPIEVAVVQPNIDPYLEKFNGSPNFIPFDQQLERLFTLSKSVLTDSLDFLLWPETALPAGYDEDLLEDQPHIRSIRNFMANFPNTALLTGSETYKIYLGEFDKTPTSRYAPGLGYYDYFNTALFFENNKKYKRYHKSKLVPGVEQMPYPQFFSFLDKFAIDLGGMTGTLGKQDKPTVFYHKNHSSVAPVICYESVYGAYVSEYVKQGAGFIGIITNDGWWGNTPGHIQHFDYSRLRAIETRRYVARSANTGISGFVDPYGQVMHKSEYWKPDCLKATIYNQDSMTFYVRNGDIVGKIAAIVAYFIVGISVIIALIIRISTFTNTKRKIHP